MIMDGHDLKYLSIDKFPLRWRFFEDAEKYTILPEEDRPNFKPLSEESSRSRWDGWVRGTLETLGTPTIFEGGENGWEKDVRRQLRNHINIPDTDPLFFFWEPTTAVETNWGIFFKYWEDFCYPSDHCNVAIMPKWPVSIVYSEEKLWIVPRQDAPYTQDEIDHLSQNERPWRGQYCGKCCNHIPQFEVISPEDERHLKSLPSIEAFKEILARTGCPIRWAKLWVFHRDGPHPSQPPCPHCGKPLRTAKAQQCFECGANWHGQRSREE